MNNDIASIAGVSSPVRTERTVSWSRQVWWSIRRELWEHRSVRIAPLVVTAIVLAGSVSGIAGLPARLQTGGTSVVSQMSTVAFPYRFAPSPIMLACFLIGLFYSLDASYGERRDRSILFWKSMPVSDRTTLFAKALIPMAVLPAIAFALCVAVTLLLVTLTSIVLAFNGVSAALVWDNFQPAGSFFVMFYGLAIHVLWFAPIYGWALLVSAWARRTPILWAILPPFSLLVFEQLAGTTNLREAFLYRLNGAMVEGFQTDVGPFKTLSDLSPLRFFTAPGLWLGWLFAGACVFIAARLRRGRDPILTS